MMNIKKQSTIKLITDDNHSTKNQKENFLSLPLKSRVFCHQQKRYSKSK